jgi:hypothetical protein
MMPGMCLTTQRHFVFAVVWVEQGFVGVQKLPISERIVMFYDFQKSGLFRNLSPLISSVNNIKPGAF